MKNIVITVISDPGHAWGAVPMRLLRELGIQDQITECSYRAHDMAYLEEDCDFATFIKAVKERGDTVTIDETFVEHFIGKDRYRPYYK